MERRNRALAAWGGLVARHRWWFLAVWLAGFAAFGYFSLQTASRLSPSGFETDTQASRTAEVVHQHFPGRIGPVLIVVLRSRSATVADPAYAAEVAGWHSQLVALAPAGTVVQGPATAAGGHDAMLVIASGATPDNFTDLGRRAKQVQVAGPATAYVGGLAGVYDTFLQDSQQALQQSERASLPIAAVLL